MAPLSSTPKGAPVPSLSVNATVPLAPCSFDGERRSCRESLERRNQRRSSKRSRGGGGKARRPGGKASSLGVQKAGAKKAAAAAPPTAPYTHSGSGSRSGGSGSRSGGSSSAAPRHLGLPSQQRTQSSAAEADEAGACLESAMRAEVDAALREAAVTGAGAGWAPQQHPPRPTAVAAYCLATSAEQQRWFQQYGLAGPVSASAAAAPPPPGTTQQHRGPAAMADLRVLPLGEVPLPLGGSPGDAGPGQRLTTRDLDDFLAMDAGEGRLRRSQLRACAAAFASTTAAQHNVLGVGCVCSGWGFVCVWEGRR